jgi:probable HAF family extracellular repeat protein
VVGQAATPGGYEHAFLYEKGVMTDLGTLPGGNISVASGINDRGQVVGSSTDASGNFHAFLYEHGVMTDLGTLSGGNGGSASAINSRGQVAGTSSTRYTPWNAVIWTPER